MTPTIAAAAVVTISVIAAVTDVRTRRIPNVLTFSAAAGAIAMHTALSGIDGLRTGLLGWLVGAGLFLPMFLLRGMGGGDVKLLAAIGAWLGPANAFWLAIYSTLAGGVMAVMVAAWHGYFPSAIRNIKTLVTYWWLVGPRPMPELTLERSGSPRLAYALPILGGTMVTLWLR